MALACSMRGSVISRGACQVRPGKTTRVARVACAAKRVVREAPATQNALEHSSEVSKLIAVSAVASSLFASGNALAAQEFADVAASDSRLGILGLLLVPALGWVAFNIFGPATRQLASMSADAPSKTRRKGVAAALGLTAASMLAAQQADAATELAQLAAADNRGGIILTLLVPAVGWVLFNILGPAQRQLQNMSEDTPKKKRGVAAVVGLTAASMLAVQSADAAQELGQLAASDNRAGIILTLLVPVLGWVGFNIFGPATRQLQSMSQDKPTKKRSVAAALGLAALPLLAQQADAAQEIGTLAASDSRAGIILTLLVPALGWVGFNILGPATRQLDAMSADKPSKRK